MRLLRRRPRSEHGVAMIEFAMVLPLLMVLFIGIAEFGLAFQQKLLVDNAVQTAARTGSSLGKSVNSDMAVLDALEQGFSGLPDNGKFLVTKVTIYRADAAGDADGNLINTYFYAAGGGCSWTPCPKPVNDTDESNIGGPWLPSTRSVDIGALDHMGVSIYYGHDWVLGGYGFLPELPCNSDGSQCWTESSVLRIEPVNL